jgi:hypothetical protein
VVIKYYIAGAEVHPFNDRENSLTSKVESGNIFYRTFNDKTFLLTNNHKLGYYDYDLLYDIEHGNNSSFKRTDNIPFIINYIKDGVEENYWTGEFNMADCEFKEERKTILVKPVVKDAYSVFFKNKDKEFNILKYGGTDSIFVNYPLVIEVYTTLGTSSTTAEEGFPGYLLVGWHLEKKERFGTLIGETEAEPFEDAYILVYTRGIIKLPFNHGITLGSTYTYLEDKSSDIQKTYAYNLSVITIDWSKIIVIKKYNDLAYAESLDLTDEEIPNTKEYFHLVTHDIESTTSIYFYYKWYIFCEKGVDYVGTMGTSNYTYKGIYYQHKRFVSLRTYLDNLLRNFVSGLTVVKSTFLFNDTPETGIGIDYTLGLNYVTGRTNILSGIYIEDMSDFRRPDTTSPAGVSMITFQQVFDALNKLFFNNLWWYVDSEGFLRIEHILYFQSKSGFNLTDPEYIKYIENENNYKYTQSVHKESFEISLSGSSDEYNSVNFKKQEIDYQYPVLIEGKTENIKDNRVENFYTDMDYILTHVDEVTSEGFVFVIKSAGYAMRFDVNGVSEAEKGIQNGYLSLSSLFNDFGAYERYQKDFLLNGVLTNAKSVKKQLQQSVEFPNLAKEKPDFSRLYITQYGAGEVEAEDFYQQGRIKLTINHVGF